MKKAKKSLPKISASTRAFLAPAWNAALEGRGALYWGAGDLRKLRALEEKGVLTVKLTGELVGSSRLVEVIASLTATGVRLLSDARAKPVL